MEKIAYGHIVEIELYKDMLFMSGIDSYIQNEFEDALLAGFGSGIPGNADLFVTETDYNKAFQIITDYKSSSYEA